MNYQREVKTRYLRKQSVNFQLLTRLGLDGPAQIQSGHFTVIASKAAGRFKGTFEGQMRLPTDNESLPTVNVVLLPDEPSLN